MDIKELVHRSRKGDESAFSRLIADRQASLYKIAYSYVKNRDDALDLVGESIYKAFISLNTLKNPEHFNAWLTRIVINLSINFINKQRKIVIADGETEFKDSFDGANREAIIDLYSAIDQLEDRQKTVIILKYLEDLPLSEVAKIMECPLGTAKTYLHKALQNLRLELKEAY